MYGVRLVRTPGLQTPARTAPPIHGDRRFRTPPTHGLDDAQAGQGLGCLGNLVEYGNACLHGIAPVTALSFLDFRVAVRTQHQDEVRHAAAVLPGLRHGGNDVLEHVHVLEVGDHRHVGVDDDGVDAVVLREDAHDIRRRPALVLLQGAGRHVDRVEHRRARRQLERLQCRQRVRGERRHREAGAAAGVGAQHAGPAAVAEQGDGARRLGTGLQALAQQQHVEELVQRVDDGHAGLLAQRRPGLLAAGQRARMR